jgi:hypothetical protein
MMAVATMPLTDPEDRTLLHCRDFLIRGYQRADGLYDIEGQLTDSKTYGFPNESRGTIGPGEPLHGMWLRLTVDEEMVIRASEAAIDFGPFAICGGGAANFSCLAGLTIGRGFSRAVGERVGGVSGCTHLREMLQQMATVAYQTLYPARMRREAEAAAREAEARGGNGGEPHDARVAAGFGGAPALLDTCHAYRADGPVVKRRWPEHYTGG